MQAILDALAARPDLDGGRVAVGGISYGGMFAIRTAAADERVRAVFAMSTWYTPAGRFAEMDDLTRPGQYQHHGPDPAANMAAMTVAGVAGRAPCRCCRSTAGTTRFAARAGGADRRRIRRPGDHGDLSRRGAHPQQPLVPGAAAGGRLARRDPLTAGGAAWTTRRPRPSRRRGSGSPAYGRPSPPVRATGALDEAALRADLDRLTGDLAIDGIFSGGVMSEFWALSGAERRRLTEVVAEGAGGNARCSRTPGSTARRRRSS